MVTSHSFSTLQSLVNPQVSMSLEPLEKIVDDFCRMHNGTEQVAFQMDPKKVRILSWGQARKIPSVAQGLHLPFLIDATTQGALHMDAKTMAYLFDQSCQTSMTWDDRPSDVQQPTRWESKMARHWAHVWMEHITSLDIFSSPSVFSGWHWANRWSHNSSVMADQDQIFWIEVGLTTPHTTFSLAFSLRADVLTLWLSTQPSSPKDETLNWREHLENAYQNSHIPVEARIHQHHQSLDHVMKWQEGTTWAIGPLDTHPTVSLYTHGLCWGEGLAHTEHDQVKVQINTVS